MLAEIPTETWILFIMAIVLVAGLLSIGCELVSIIFSDVADDNNEA